MESMPIPGNADTWERRYLGAPSSSSAENEDNVLNRSPAKPELTQQSLSCCSVPLAYGENFFTVLPVVLYRCWMGCRDDGVVG